MSSDKKMERASFDAVHVTHECGRCHPFWCLQCVAALLEPCHPETIRKSQIEGILTRPALSFISQHAGALHVLYIQVQLKHQSDLVNHIRYTALPAIKTRCHKSYLCSLVTGAERHAKRENVGRQTSE